MFIKSNLQNQKILYGIILFVMVIATTGARGAPPYKLGSNEQSLDSNEMGGQFLQPISFEQEADSAPEMVNINSSYALKMDILDKGLIQPYEASSDNITIDLRGPTPTPGTLVGDTVYIVVSVTSLYIVQSVIVVVETRETNLTYSDCAYHIGTMGGGVCQPGWLGTISLEGLTRGTQVLTITATDIYGNMGIAEFSYVYDKKPILTIQAPLNNTVARPEIHIIASCTDDDPAGCVSIVVSFWRHSQEIEICASPANIDQVISLEELDGQEVTLYFS